MEKKHLLIVGIILVIIVVFALFFGFNKNIEEWVTGRESILTESLYFNDERIAGELRRNKIDNTSTIEIKYFINDTEEYTNFSGKQTASVPFLVNFVCALFPVAFFNPEALQELKSKGNITAEESDLSELIKEITITRSSLTFLDKETNEKIAECTATGSEWEDIEFKAYRDYSNVGSLFGAEIGKKRNKDGIKNR